MRQKISTILLASIVLFLCLGADRCGGSNLERVIAAVEGAPLLVSTFNIPVEQRDAINDGFGTAADCLRAFKRNPEAGNSTHVRNCVGAALDRDVFKNIGDEQAHRRISAVVFLVKTVFNLTSGGQEAGARSTAAPGEIIMRDEDVKKLEELLKP